MTHRGDIPVRHGDRVTVATSLTTIDDAERSKRTFMFPPNRP